MVAGEVISSPSRLEIVGYQAGAMNCIAYGLLLTALAAWGIAFNDGWSVGVVLFVGIFLLIGTSLLRFGLVAVHFNLDDERLHWRSALTLVPVIHGPWFSLKLSEVEDVSIIRLVLRPYRGSRKLIVGLTSGRQRRIFFPEFGRPRQPEDILAAYHLVRTLKLERRHIQPPQVPILLAICLGIISAQRGRPNEWRKSLLVIVRNYHREGPSSPRLQKIWDRRISDLVTHVESYLDGHLFDGSQGEE